jgi:ubiquinone/menaquinone biosynthesis C-methylase UbiE
MSRIQNFLQISRANGPLWTILYFSERVFGENMRQKRIAFEIKNKLQGFNTIQYNLKEWSNYNWSGGGEEWSDSGEWKKSLINKILLKYIQPKRNVLEIGPGGGRWSIILAELSQKLILVDLTEKSIEHCRNKLKQFPHCEYHINNGYDLSFIKDESINYIWSFDVFVHISPADTEKYLKAFNDVLAKDGIAIIHHPAAGGIIGGFRSSMTNDFFLTLLKKYNFEVIHQLDSWEENHSVRKFMDMITIFKKT